MKLHCRNNCGRAVRDPRSSSWKEEGICPSCRDKRSLSRANKVFKTIRTEEPSKMVTPVDMYWHAVTSKYLKYHEK